MILRKLLSLQNLIFKKHSLFQFYDILVFSSFIFYSKVKIVGKLKNPSYA